LYCETFFDNVMSPGMSEPPSPSNFELTDAALRKSQILLRQLSDFTLECDDKTNDQYTGGIASPSARSQASLWPEPETKQMASSDTIEMPVALLQMLADNWAEMHLARAASQSRTLSASVVGALDRDGACKDRPGNSSSSSTASTSSLIPTHLTADCDSDFGTESQYSGTFEAVEVSAPPCLAQSMSRTIAPRVAASIRATSPQPRVLSFPPVLVSTHTMRSSPLLFSPRQALVCQRQFATAAPSSPMVTVTASVPLGSSVSVSVTTQALHHTQSVRLSIC